MLSRRKSKAQALTEFALILPILLMLILGVLEASRIVWAYITVQTAAREAARYAISGRPNLLSTATGDCTTPEGEVNGEPWVCDPEDRAAAIRAVAIERGETLFVSEICGDDGVPPSSEYIDPACRDLGGAFGVVVSGQFVDTSTDPTSVGIKADYAGDQGLNVVVATYYNVEMIDPIFDTILGGNFIRVRGEVEMQNEGLDQSLGFPPPPSNISFDPEEAGGVFSSGAAVVPERSEQQQNLPLEITLRTHQIGTYHVVLEEKVPGSNPAAGTGVKYTIGCEVDGGATEYNVTSPSVEVAATCVITQGVTAGDYLLYSTKTTDQVAIGWYGEASNPSTFTVLKGDTPLVQIDGGDVWASNSNVSIKLVNHQDALDGPFDVYYSDGTNETLIQGGITDTTPDLDITNWRIPKSLEGKCPQGSSTPCTLITRKSSEPSPGGIIHASGEFYVNTPEIILSQAVDEYPRGALLTAFLQGHTPNSNYDIRIEGVTSGIDALVANVSTDGIGQFSPIEEFIQIGWTDGAYKLRTYEPGDTSTPIASVDFTINTPAGPYITVDGGYTWPIDSTINIRLFQHDPNVIHYLNFGNIRVKVSGGGDTFDSGSSGAVVLPYRIPITAATASTGPKLYEVASHHDSTGALQATRDVTVLPVPVIRVLEGDTVLPNSEITIRIDNHSPNTSYKIYYGKDVGIDTDSGKFLFTMITDGSGSAERTYALKDLPLTPAPDFTKPDTCGCYGVFYHMYSEAINLDRVAFTQMAISPADLAITKVELPPNVEINTTAPITLTIANLRPVTVSRYFDVDFYQNPAPLIPKYNANNFNFPGDAKYWENYLAPNGQPGYTVTVTHPDFFFNEYGDFDIYGFADTTDYILYEASETNNITNTVVSVTCVPQQITNGFTWGERRYNSGWTQKQAGSFANADGSLRLISDGFSTYGNNDDASNRGHYYVHLQNPITTSTGVDFIVRVTDVGDVTFNSKGGMQLRDTLNSRSRKIEFNLYWDSFENQYRLQVSVRTGFSNNVTGWKDSGLVDLTSGPVWLRINRKADSNTFRFYYAQQSAKPTTDAEWGSPYTEASVDMADFLYAGVFNASYWNNNYTTSDFDNFTYTDASVCANPATVAPDPVPAGITQCTDLLEEVSFESVPAQNWILGSDEGVTQAASVLQAHSGLYRVVAPTFDLGFNEPYFYQKFTMPSFVISTTTNFSFNIYQKDDALGSDDAADQFYAIVSTAPSPASAITDPKLIADGIHTQDYQFVNVTLPITSSVNVEDYADQDLYLYLYNTSNSTCGAGTCHDTEYSFDDAKLTVCTTQPPPSPITTQMSGSVTLHRLGGSSERLPGVRVWAYAEGGQLFETFTAADGSYNFYNLPLGEYVIYSEYHFIDPIDPSQIETLATNSTTTVKSSDTGANPLVLNLDLYTITP